ncbi:MAG: oligopeptide:H+ symporter [Myxococcota bacterium]
MAGSVASKDAPPVGHPRGLSTLFFTEMWERFSFYGMRAIFAPFMGLAIGEGGLGYDEAQRGSVLALYTSAVYMMSLPGGWVADKFLGQKRAVMIGGLIIMLGHILLAIPALGSFYAGLGCLVIGTGFLKPNVSSMVGQLYAKGDARRDGGFAIFYMGINIGAFASPIICGWLAHNDGFKAFLADLGISPHYSWHVAFGAAAVGMAIGLTQYWFGRANLDGIGEPPSYGTSAERAQNLKILAAIIGAILALPLGLWLVDTLGYALNEERISNIFGVVLLTVFVSTFVVLYVRATSDKERKGILAMIALALGCIAFFALFEQAAGVMNDFADKRTETVAFGRAFPAEWFQSVNSVFIMLLSPLFAWGFTWVIQKKLRFNDIRKFAVALVFMALGYVVMLPAAGGSGVSPWFLVGFYFFSTVAELFLSPVGLSSMSKLAPPSAAGLVMGVWFLSTSNGEWLAGKAQALTADVSESELFEIVIIGGLAVAALLFALGWYFTHKVPLESLHQGKDVEADESGVLAVAASQRAQVTGNGIAGFATAVALWPVVATDPGLGLAICCILGPSVVFLALRGLTECRSGTRVGDDLAILPVGGKGFALATFPIALGAVAYALIKVL